MDYATWDIFYSWPPGVSLRLNLPPRPFSISTLNIWYKAGRLSRGCQTTLSTPSLKPLMATFGWQRSTGWLALTALNLLSSTPQTLHSCPAIELPGYMSTAGVTCGLARNPGTLVAGVKDASNALPRQTVCQSKAASFGKTRPEKFGSAWTGTLRTTSIW